MVRNSQQAWTPGSQVQVGFMRLRVLRAVPTPGDFAPDAYVLINLKGDRLYKFVPHNGLHSIDMDEANALIAEAVRIEGPVVQTRAVAA